MMDNCSPALTPGEVERLPTEFTDVPPASVAYGSHIVIGVTEYGWSYLEAAVRAGHMPHFEGIELALAAYFLFCRREIRQLISGGTLGDAIDWAEFSVRYRRLAETLLAEAQVLESVAAYLNVTESPEQVSLDEWAHLLGLLEGR